MATNPSTTMYEVAELTSHIFTPLSLFTKLTYHDLEVFIKRHLLACPTCRANADSRFSDINRKVRLAQATLANAKGRPEVESAEAMMPITSEVANLMQYYESCKVELVLPKEKREKYAEERAARDGFRKMLSKDLEEKCQQDIEEAKKRMADT